MMRSVTLRLLRQQPVIRQFSSVRSSRLSSVKAPPLLSQTQVIPFSTSILRSIDPKKVSESALEKEREVARQQKLKSDPEHVDSTSSVRPMLDVGSTPGAADDGTDMLAGIKSDFKTVRETFALRDIPKEVYIFGLGGLVPYVVTSATTLVLAWDMNAATYGLPYLVNPRTADALLHILEPAQVAYGAIILSFLGAIHWGLEFAQYGGSHPLQRYTIGVLAPALAWPTVLLPLDYALLIQFVGFTGMYFADAQMTTWGWTPRWYMTYRFILTFVVGACIVATLVGRGQIGDNITPTQRARDHLATLREAQRKHRDTDMEKTAREEERSIARTKATKEENEEPKDPGKAAKGDQEGTQGVYPDDKQDSSDSKKDKQSPETTYEKKNLEPRGGYRR